MTPHFYNLRCRLGMINLPHRQKEFNIGVEAGGDAILTDDFLKKFPDSLVDVYDFPKPEKVNKKDYYDVLSKTLKETEKLLEKTLKDNDIPVVLGGDNSVSFPAMVTTLKRYKSTRVGYISIDSHPDMNSISSSPTGNFHGMRMRPFVGSFEHKGIARLVENKISLFQVLIIGNLDVNPGEKEFFNGQSTVFSPEYLRQNKESVMMNLDQFLNNYQHIYLGIDIDGFDRSIAPATGIPAQNGLLLDDVEPVLERLKEHLVCVDLVEVNPKKPGAEKTVELAQVILSSLFS